MPVIVPSTPAGKGRLAYKNLFNDSGATVTASTQETGFEKENAYDWLGYDWWKPTATGDSWIRCSFATAKDANYMAVWGHNLADHSATIKAQYSSDGIVWNDAHTVITPLNNNTIFITWDTIGYKHWRVWVNNPTTIASIAGVMIGESVELPHNMEIGFSPAALVPTFNLKTAESETGAFIGGSKISEGIEGGFSMTQIDPAWVRSEWVPFIEHVQTPRPFVFCWDAELYQDEAILGWYKNKPRKPSYDNSTTMQFDIEFVGLP